MFLAVVDAVAKWCAKWNVRLDEHCQLKTEREFFRAARKLNALLEEIRARGKDAMFKFDGLTIVLAVTQNGKLVGLSSSPLPCNSVVVSDEPDTSALDEVEEEEDLGFLQLAEDEEDESEE